MLSPFQPPKLEHTAPVQYYARDEEQYKPKGVRHLFHEGAILHDETECDVPDGPLHSWSKVLAMCHHAPVHRPEPIWVLRPTLLHILGISISLVLDDTDRSIQHEERHVGWKLIPFVGLRDQGFSREDRRWRNLCDDAGT